MAGYSLVPMTFFQGYTLPPLQIFLEVTYKCNLRCEFCQFLQGTEAHLVSGRQELNTAEFYALLKDLPRWSILSFTGGEPFLKSGFLDLLGYASKRNHTHVFTNGTMISPAIAEYLIAIAAKNPLQKGLLLLGISLEGQESTHNQIVKSSSAYGKTITAIQCLLESRRKAKQKFPLVELKTVISEKNVSEVYDIFCLARDLGVDLLNLMIMSMLPHASRLSQESTISYSIEPPAVQGVDLHILREELRRIEEESRHSTMQIRTTPQGITFDEILRYYANAVDLNCYRCYYPWYGMGVTAYGDTLICPYIITGNLRKDGFKQALNSRQARDFRNKLRDCGIFPGCRGCCMQVPKSGL